MSSPAPKSPEQSEKTKKYDRQLRLWGDHGQTALEASQVCLINATALGTEILKSLVLPGIGGFTIVDGKKIIEEDVGSNFFLEAESIGKSRSAVALRLLLELNPDVHGDSVDEDVDQVLLNNPDFFNNFHVVIGTALSERTLITLSEKLWECGIPLIVCRSYGFLGYMRIQVAEHTVVESHPDNQNPDLRLDQPFQGLREHVDSIQLSSLELKEHAHIPYVVILLKVLDKWKAEKGLSLPKNRMEKEEFKDIIRQNLLVDEHGNVEAEENFEEAIKAVNSCIQPTTIPSSIREILDDDACVNLTSKSKPFWIMAKAIRDFVENEGKGHLPLRGSVPDMTAKTDYYVALQQVYYEHAARDTDVVYRRVQQLLHQLNQTADTISESDVKQFCKFAACLHVMRGSKIADEYHPKSTNNMLIAQELENPDSMMVYYVMLRGVDRFYSEYNLYPGEFEVEPDIVKLKSCISKLLNEWGCGMLAKDDYVHEICRYGGSELHSVSSFMGGCVAQEVIKFITHQYKPINNTFIYDAMTSNTVTYNF
ncbi:NEDD8-activating enzyme E1 regulatory subunit [Frankliniella occidentalis]|uniref:NEDD8-activating enzyme E1 regulatory subunit n=1 Tax=Frankliniella occidentalis TaxID=133901 RepID=A0A6J1STI0_FRAOC|nr:NEDD8-activating enzyme E1 regulatory subunit [Frankliniella occidentalis]XP_026284163.1 NEDD8-activating enzyme E1 regulatory subunit [Frankliniella occidentalis]XP_052124566.1 NEDD8-activating enzyme E1 regulatory subunit [Frankliniella occidentalis]